MQSLRSENRSESMNKIEIAILALLGAAAVVGAIITWAIVNSDLPMWVKVLLLK